MNERAFWHEKRKFSLFPTHFTHFFIIIWIFDVNTTRHQQKERSRKELIHFFLHATKSILWYVQYITCCFRWWWVKKVFIFFTRLAFLTSCILCFSFLRQNYDAVKTLMHVKKFMLHGCWFLFTQKIIFFSICFCCDTMGAIFLLVQEAMLLNFIFYQKIDLL